MEYHIDGIHANCEEAVMRMVETDNLLCTTKTSHIVFQIILIFMAEKVKSEILPTLTMTLWFAQGGLLRGMRIC